MQIAFAKAGASDRGLRVGDSVGLARQSYHRL